MKKGLITLSFCMALLLILSSMAMAQTSEERLGSFVIKAGVMIPTEDSQDLLGGANFTVEGEYTVYSTEYIDFCGIFGYYRTGFNSPAALGNNYSFEDFNSIYYMGGIKIYPTKETFYICGYAGGGSTFVTGTIRQYNTLPLTQVDSSYSGFAFKVGLGADIENFVIEASYLVQDSEDLTKILNSYGDRGYRNHGGIQIMGGYRF